MADGRAWAARRSRPSPQGLFEGDPGGGGRVAVLDQERDRGRQAVALARSAPSTARAPGTTTAPGGTTSGRSSVPWRTRPRTRSYSARRPGQGHARTDDRDRPDEDALEEGAARTDERAVLDDHRAGARRLEDAADRDPGREVDLGADLGARPDEHVRVDHRAGPIQAPTLTYDGGITTTPSPRNAPRRTAVPPGTIRHGPPARSVRGGTDARSRNVSGPTRPVDRGAVGKAGEDGGLDLGSDAPAVRCVRIRLGGPDPARFQVLEDRRRIVAGVAARGDPASAADPADAIGAVMPRPRAIPFGPRSGHRRSRAGQGRAGSRPSPPDRRGRAAGAGRGPRRTRAGPSATGRP